MNSILVPKNSLLSKQSTKLCFKSRFRRSCPIPTSSLSPSAVTIGNTVKAPLPWICSIPFKSGRSFMLIEKESKKEERQTSPRSATYVGITSIGVQWLIGVGFFIVCITASIFFISALSALAEARLAARRVNIVMRLLELEMPETMAAMRLSSIELSDCIEEFTSLGSDLASGLRTSANMVVAAEKGVQQGTRVLQDSLLPAIQSKAPKARKVLEDLLQERAMLQHDQILNVDLTRRTTNRLKAIRRGVNLVGLGAKAASLWKSLPTRDQSKATHDKF